MIIEISETYPSIINPNAGHFVERHVRELRKNNDILLVVPLRYLPPRKCFSGQNIFKILRKIRDYYSGMNIVKKLYRENNILCIPYLSIPSFLMKHFDQHVRARLLFSRTLKHINKKVDSVYVHWFTPNFLLALKLAKFFGVPLILDLHENVESISEDYKYSRKNALLLMSKASAIIVHSKKNLENIKELFLKYKINLPKTELVFLGLSLPIESKKNCDINLPVKLLSVTNFDNPYKNYNDLLRCLSILKNDYKLQIELIIIGGGKFYTNCLSEINRMGLNQQVKLMGSLHKKELTKYYLNSDIFVYTSLRDSFGLVIIEAMSHGLPVVSYKNVGATYEINQIESVILTANENDVNDLTLNIVNLINDHSLREYNVKRGKELCEELFTWESHRIKMNHILNGMK